MAGPETQQPDTIRTNLTPDQVVDRLMAMAKRGNLAGFDDKVEDGLFTVAAFGSPFDGELVARADREGEATVLSFELRLLRKMPIVFAIMLVIMIEPGQYFTNQFIATVLPGLWGWPVPTWVWYYPLTIIPIPFIWRGLMRKTRGAMAESADEAIGKIRTEVGG